MKLEKIISHIVGAFALAVCINIAGNALAQKQYALFTCIPFNGTVPTLKSYGLNSNVKTLIEKVEESEGLLGLNYSKLEFDSVGRLTLKESNYDDAYAPERYRIEYGDNGKVKTIFRTFQPGTQEGDVPFVIAKYEYIWDGENVSQIIENLTVDKGVNYKGQTTLDLSYDANGKLVSAKCREVPEVELAFRNGNIAGTIYNGCRYEDFDEKQGRTLDHLFSDVKSSKRPLSWRMSDVSDPYSNDVINTDSNLTDMPLSCMIRYNIDYTSSYTKDSRGNWVKAIIKDLDGSAILSREITYFDSDEDVVVVVKEEELICENPDKVAEFPGGQAALMKWLSNNMRYPESAQTNAIQGRVIVKFVVEKDGSISNVTVAKSVAPDLDREAKRLVGKMPRWQPGIKNGVPVRTYYSLPYTFKLQI